MPALMNEQNGALAKLSLQSLKRKRQEEGHQHDSLHSETLNQVKSFQRKTNELLRHFWANVGAVSSSDASSLSQTGRDKCSKIVEALKTLKTSQRSMLANVRQEDHEKVNEVTFHSSIKLIECDILIT